MQHPLERAVSRPLLEAPVTGLVRRVATRQVLPRRPCAEHPQNPVEHLAPIPARPPATIRSTPRLRNQRLKDLPLRLSQIHPHPDKGDASTREATGPQEPSSNHPFAHSRDAL
jgi:hypothetical protein